MPTFTLIGYATSPGGRPRVGTVAILPNTEIRHLDGSPLMVGPDRVTTDALGAWTIELPCDGADVNPSQGIGYRLEYALSGASRSPQEFYATADLAGTVLNVADLVTTELDWPTPLTTTKGDKGDKGDTGNTGPANTLAIGAVTTGAAGSQATATITGAAPNQSLSLGIPKGDPGGWVTSSNIAAGVSLDTLTTPGLYLVAAAGQSDPLLSLPAVSWRGHVEVVAASPSVIMQRATSVYSDDANGTGGLTDRGNVYFRSRNGASWGPWLKLQTTGQIGSGDLVGTGTPEGVRAAPVGTYYTDTSGTNGAWRWMKRTGTGNTGWVVVDGDTGWRVITSWTTAGVVTGQALSGSWIPSPGLGGDIRIRRVNQTVSIGVRNLTRKDAVTIPVWATYTVPAEFRPSIYLEVVTYAGVDPTSLWFGTDGSFTRGTGSRSGASGEVAGTGLLAVSGQAQSTAWPSVLPGS